MVRNIGEKLAIWTCVSEDHWSDFLSQVQGAPSLTIHLIICTSLLLEIASCDSYVVSRRSVCVFFSQNDTFHISANKACKAHEVLERNLCAKIVPASFLML